MRQQKQPGQCRHGTAAHRYSAGRYAPTGHSPPGTPEQGAQPKTPGGKEVVYQPKDVEVIDTSAFIKTDMKYGLDFVFRLVDSVNLIQKSKFRRHTWKTKSFPQGVTW